jgi:hypothetical protein
MMKLCVRVLAVCGLAVIFSQSSAQAQYSKRPFANGNEWHYRFQQAARGEISKPELYRWVNEGQPPRGRTIVLPPRTVVPNYPYRPNYGRRPAVWPYLSKPVVVPGTINSAPKHLRR